MNDEEEKQIFDTLATSKQVLDSGQKLLAMRDEKIKALEAKMGEWRARAENAELELETARERLEVLDEVINDALGTDQGLVFEFLASDRSLEDEWGAPGVRLLLDSLMQTEVQVIKYFDADKCPLWTRFGLELRRRAKQREQKR
jgi:hypothetical protein